MIKLIFKNLENSSLVREIVQDRLGHIQEKFPDLKKHRIYVTLSMDNSSFQAGPDEFGVKVHIAGQKFGSLTIEKKAASLYIALAEVSEAILELLNRRTDKLRVKSRSQSRTTLRSVNRNLAFKGGSAMEKTT